MITELFGYNLLCTNNLRKQFDIGIHTDPIEVEKAFNICRDTLIREFETECKKIQTTYSVSFFLNTYTNLCKEVDAKNSFSTEYIHETIIGKRLCKYIFPLLTQNYIIDSSENSINENDISKLMYLTDSLYQLSQKQNIFYLFDNDGFKLELNDESFDFEIIDEKYRINNPYQWDEFKGSFLKDEHLPEFVDTTIEAFGLVADQFYDLVFRPQPNILDISSMSFKDFRSLIYNTQPEISRDGIIDLTSLFRAYPDEAFLKGLTLKKENVSLIEVYKNPLISHRIRYRPILELHTNKGTAYITTPQLAFEALSEHITNQLPFDSLPSEWESNDIMKRMAKDWKDNHDQWLDDFVQRELEKGGYQFLRNTKGIDNISLLKTKSSINGRNIGEIDFIILDDKNKTLYVTDTKFFKTKSEPATFCGDKEKFINGDKPYNEQLIIKYEWIKNNLNHVQNEFKRQRKIVSILDYKVELFFITNAPTFYSWISPYPIIPAFNLLTYLQSKHIK